MEHPGELLGFGKFRQSHAVVLQRSVGHCQCSCLVCIVFKLRHRFHDLCCCAGSFTPLVEACDEFLYSVSDACETDCRERYPDVVQDSFECDEVRLVLGIREHCVAFLLPVHLLAFPQHGFDGSWFGVIHVRVKCRQGELGAVKFEEQRGLHIFLERGACDIEHFEVTCSMCFPVHLLDNAEVRYDVPFGICERDGVPVDHWVVCVGPFFG